MPKINSIPYENAEDLNKFLYDNYYTTEQIQEEITGTGYTRKYIFELSQETGVTENSTNLNYYNNLTFNPLYSEVIWKGYMNSMDDVFVFFGFKETTGAPTFDMVESHAGFMIEDSKLYVSVANGTDQQRIEIVGIDLTRVQNYKINFNKFSIQALPQVRSKLGVKGVLQTFPLIIRKWVQVSQLSNFPPENKDHYIVQYIKNSTNDDKRIIFNRFICKETFAD